MRAKSISDFKSYGLYGEFMKDSERSGLGASRRGRISWVHRILLKVLCGIVF